MAEKLNDARMLMPVAQTIGNLGIAAIDKADLPDGAFNLTLSFRRDKAGDVDVDVNLVVKEK